MILWSGRQASQYCGRRRVCMDDFTRSLNNDFNENTIVHCSYVIFMFYHFRENPPCKLSYSPNRRFVTPTSFGCLSVLHAEKVRLAETIPTIKNDAVSNGSSTRKIKERLHIRLYWYIQKQKYLATSGELDEMRAAALGALVPSFWEPDTKPPLDLKKKFSKGLVDFRVVDEYDQGGACQALLHLLSAWRNA